mgnify:CR=1 FL=1
MPDICGMLKSVMSTSKQSGAFRMACRASVGRWNGNTRYPRLRSSLLVARHGKGHYVYTGLAFFRQLPAGVPGAYRLFANLLALGSAP